MNYPPFKHYQILSQVYEGKNAILLRGIRNEDQKTVMIKYLKPEFSTPKLMQQLSTEYERQSNIKSPYVVKTLELLAMPNSMALVMEDFSHPSLEDIFKKQLPLETKVAIAIEIARALGEIHHEQVIHKDIKPQNILIDLETLTPKIIDFGISSLLGRELQQLVPPEALEGTLPYMSPEQTGRINRQLDYRSDIYSLGITLYQLFTGELPFQETSALNYIHAHIAKPPPKSEKIPENLFLIILKCLAKSADERYHSAFGLMIDLQNYTKANFTIGSKDVYDHFHFPEKLYGREKEEKLLVEAFQKVLKGEKFLLTLSGNAGVGKSSLAAQGQKLIAPYGGRFAQSKFDQFKRTVPYQGLANALQKLVQKILMESDESLKEWKIRLTDVLGDSAQALIEIIPDIEFIIGKQPPLPKLPPQETINRVKYTLTNFFKGLQRAGSPIIIFLDDLQWADEPSLKLISYIFEDPAVQNLLILSAYRDNEVTPAHPLALTLEEIKAKGGEIIHLAVNPLEEEGIQEMIRDLYKGDEIQSEKLGSLLYKKAKGNPFFTLQLLKKLYEENLFYFDMDEIAWKADLESIAKLQVTDNVVTFLVGELKQLTPSVLNLLKIGSAIESRFPLDLISSISSLPEEQVKENLKEALRGDLLLQEEGAHIYRFMHDRIQQAVYSLIEENEKKQIHESIGRILLSKTPKERLGDQVIEIVNHLNHSDMEAWNSNDRIELSKLNLMAGLKAKDSGAFAQSIQYLRKGIELLPEKMWEREAKLTLELHENLAMALIVTGGSNEAENIFQDLLRKATDDVDIGRIWSIRLLVYAQQRDYDRLFEQAKKALGMYGYHFETDPSKWSIIKSLLKLRLKGLRNIEKIKDLPIATDPKAHTITFILSALCYPAFILNKKNQYIKNAVDILQITLEKGLTQNSSVGIGNYAIFMGSEIMQKYNESFQLGEACLAVAQKYPKTAETASMLFSYYAFMHRWKFPLHESIVPMRQAYKTLMEAGAGALGASCAIYCNLLPLLSGEKLEKVLHGINDYLNDIKKYSPHAEELSLCVLREVAKSLQGFNQDASDPLPPEFSESSKEEENVLYKARYDIWHTVLSYLFGYSEKAVEIGKNTVEYIHKYPNWLEWHPFYFIYGLALVDTLKKGSNRSKENSLALKECLKKLKRWAKAAPINYEHHLLLVEAQFSTLKSDDRITKDLFEEAIDSAKKSDQTQDIALAYELYGKYLYQQGNSYGARILLLKALQYYRKWGAEAKVRQLNAQFQELFEKEKDRTSNQKFSRSITTTTKSGTDSRGETLDIGTILEASQTLSREIALDKLIESLMHLLIINAGADRAFLILAEENHLFVYSKIYLNNRYFPLPVPLPLDEMGDEMSLSIVNYVFRKEEPVLLEDAVQVGPFTEDPFIKKFAARSILCIPLRHKQKLAGILYLENRSAKGVFTTKKARILGMLSSQIAVSLVNAKLYEKMESKIQERTRELQDKNKELQEAFKTIRTVQDQMVQKEKIASLGLMTAGIGQELNVPLEEVSQLSKALNQRIMELNYLALDKRPAFIQEMRETLKKIEGAGKKADEIIKGLLSYAHQGSSARQKIDPSELLNQALDHVIRLFKSKEDLFKVVTIVTPAEPPCSIEAYPTDLMRVFVNIIHNAFEAMYEKWSKDSNYKPIFEIIIYNRKNKVEIKLHDNGPGIPLELVPNIFTPFALTNKMKTATGFGLSIAKDIVTKEHRGSIELTKHHNEFEITIVLPVELD